MANNNIPELIAQLRATFATRKTRPYEWRIEQLKQLKAMIVEKEGRISAALKADLGKSSFESFLTEAGANLTEINHTLKHLKDWMKPQKVSTPITNQPGYSKIIHEPLGTVLIVGPWNYPFYLIVAPLVGAIAAGNCAVLKPSELTPKTSALLAELIAKYMDTDAIRVIEGGVEVVTELLDHPFDHIFFTGSTRVGKIVMAAAAKHLTPVTLELGGKSPCIVHEDADLKVAARRIAWGKFINAGQTCVAPDYVLVDEKIADKFVQHLEAAVAKFYDGDSKASDDFPKIVNNQNFDRLTELINGGEIVFGGDTDRAERYIEPTVLSNVSPDSPIMQEEIFGPILPILKTSSVDQAIAFVNDRPKPLALYVFSKDKEVGQKVVEQTSSGGVCINDVVVHLAVPDLPFGGVGPSGIGAYHGQSSFTTFSHAKGVLVKSNRGEIPLRYPPYTDSKYKWMKRLS